GTADATLLFLIVFSYAFQWSGDKEILNRYRSHAEAALKWMLEHGDRDGDGFQEYKTRSPRGFYCQGWKDSHDAIRHEDGSIAPLPHALCELQGYAFDALLRMSEAFQIWVDAERAVAVRQRATRLFEDFTERFGIRRRNRLPRGSLPRPSASSTTDCPSSGLASRANPARIRCPISARTCPRPGRRRRSSG